MPTSVCDSKFVVTIANGQTTATVTIPVNWSGFIHRLQLTRTSGGGTYNITADLYSSDPNSTDIPAAIATIIPQQSGTSANGLSYRDSVGVPYCTPNKERIIYLKLVASAAVSGDQTWKGSLVWRSTDS